MCPVCDSVLFALLVSPLLGLHLRKILTLSSQLKDKRENYGSVPGNSNAQYVCDCGRDGFRFSVDLWGENFGGKKYRRRKRYVLLYVSLDEKLLSCAFMCFVKSFFTFPKTFNGKLNFHQLNALPFHPTLPNLSEYLSPHCLPNSFRYRLKKIYISVNRSNLHPIHHHHPLKIKKINFPHCDATKSNQPNSILMK